MSLSNIRPYFRERLELLGFSEHEDGFNVENIPKTKLNKSFHISVPSIQGGAINHTHQDTVSGVEVSLFFCGFRNVGLAIDDAILSVETIVKDVCRVSNRTRDVLNVVFEGAEFNPLNDQDDNSVAVTMSFTAQVVLCVEEQI
jgi:hypothetical protein